MGGGVPRVPPHHPDLARGYTPPSRPDQGEYPPHHQDLARGYPGYPPTIQTWLGYPPPQEWGTHPNIQTWMGYLPSKEWGTPTIQTCLGYPPPPQTWDGVPPNPDMGWDAPPIHPDLQWGTPPTNVNRQTPVKTVPSRGTMYAGGNKPIQEFVMQARALTAGLVTHIRQTLFFNKHQFLI